MRTYSRGLSSSRCQRKLPSHSDLSYDAKGSRRPSKYCSEARKAQVESNVFVDHSQPPFEPLFSISQYQNDRADFLCPCMCAGSYADCKH